MEFRFIDLDIQGAVARINFNRPDKLNSLNHAMMLEIHQAVDAVQSSTDIRVLVLTGNGRAFCAGQDLADPAMQDANGKPPDIGNLVELLYKPLVLKLQNLRVPTIAAVNGLAAGAGASIALACDIVLAAQSAYFLQAFSKIGLTPDTGSTWFLSHRVGTARAIGLTMLADKLPAAKAAQWGLIWDVLDDDQFEAGIDAAARRVASMATKALVRTRYLVHAADSHTLDQQLSMEASTIRELGWSQDYREGVQAFSEKRLPRFTGD